MEMVKQNNKGKLLITRSSPISKSCQYFILKKRKVAIPMKTVLPQPPERLTDNGHCVTVERGEGGSWDSPVRAEPTPMSKHLDPFLPDVLNLGPMILEVLFVWSHSGSWFLRICCMPGVVWDLCVPLAGIGDVRRSSVMCDVSARSLAAPSEAGR